MKKVILLAVIAGCAAAAWSQAPEEPATANRDTGGDPNEIVCVKELQLGSRLATRRVCRTRRQWEEHHRELKWAVKIAQESKQSSGN